MVLTTKKKKNEKCVYNKKSHKQNKQMNGKLGEKLYSYHRITKK